MRQKERRSFSQSGLKKILEDEIPDKLLPPITMKRFLVFGYAIAIILFMAVYALIAIFKPEETLTSMGDYLGKVSQVIKGEL